MTSWPAGSAVGLSLAPARPRLSWRVSAWLHGSPNAAALLFCGPALLFMAALYVYPLSQTLLRSLDAPESGLSNYARLFSTDIYLASIGITFRISAIVTALCLLLGYPVAYMLTRLSASARAVAFVLILIPFWTSALVRTYAWTVLLQRRGVINSFLLDHGIISTPLALSYNTIGTIIGNVHVLLPITILTIYSIVSRIDTSLVTAARTMGAGPLRAFLWIYAPLSIPAVMAGGMLTFVASLSSYIIPALLGGRRDLFIAQLIDQQVNSSLDVGFASAIAIALLLVCLVLCFLYTKIVFSPRVTTKSEDLTRNHPVGSGGYSLATYAYGFLVLIFLFLPVFILVPLSFSSARYLTFPPPGYSLQWYENYLGNPTWIEATFRSFRIGIVSALVAGGLGTLAALGLSRMTADRIKYPLFALLLSPLLVPNIIFALAIYQLYSKLHLIGTETGLVLAHAVLGLPYVVITVLAAISSRDIELAVAARTLGAGPLRAFRAIVLPLIGLSAIVGSLLAFIASFDEVVVAIFVSGSRAFTLPKMMWDGVTNEVDPTISAVSVIVIASSLVVALAICLVGKLGRNARAD